MHILLVPVLTAGLLSAHLAILWPPKHTQFPGPGRTEDNIVGSKLWPTYALRSIGLFAGVFGVFGMIAALGGLAQVNVVWLSGRSRRQRSAPPLNLTGTWAGWKERCGCSRRGGSTLFGYTFSELFWPGVVLPGLTFGLLYIWPFLEARVTRARSSHQLLDRPRERPVRTAMGVGVLSAYVVLLIAGSQDIVSQKTSTPIPTVLSTFRSLLVAVPIVATLITWRVCRDLRGADEIEHAKHEIRAGFGPVPRRGSASPVTAELVAAPTLLARVVSRVLVAVTAAAAAGGMLGDAVQALRRRRRTGSR